MAKEQANYPNSLDVLNVDRLTGQAVPSSAFDILEDAVTEIEEELRRVTTKTAVATLTANEGGLILVSCAVTPYTLGLPSAVGNNGLTYDIIKTDDNTNLITIDADGTETIDGQLTFTELNYQYAHVKIKSDNVNWYVLFCSSTASNIGLQAEIFKQKIGVDLEFRTLKEGTGVTFAWFEEGAGYDLKYENTSGTDEYDAKIATGQSRAIVYTPDSSYNLKKFTLYMKKVGTPSADISVNVYLADGSHFPTGDSLGSASINQSVVGTSYADKDFIFSESVSLIDGTEYVITFTSSCSASGSYYRAARYVLAAHTALFNVTTGWNLDSGKYYKVKLYASDMLYYDYIEIIADPSEIRLDDLKVTEDNTDLNTSITKHGLMPKLPFSGDLLSTTTVAFNANGDTTLYTVPTGKRCILTHAIVVAAGDAGATTTISIGANGAETDFIPANTLSNLDIEFDSVILQSIPNTTPLKIKSYVAATVIEAQVASQSGVAGNTIYLFGILY